MKPDFMIRWKYSSSHLSKTEGSTALDTKMIIQHPVQINAVFVGNEIITVYYLTTVGKKQARPLY